MKTETLRLAVSQDSWAAIAWLAAQPDPVAVAKVFSEAMLHLYWQEKNLPLSLAFGRAGAQYSLTAADGMEASDPTKALELRGSAKAMTYNLASFTWPGWNEPGIVTTSSDVALGLDAAKTNLRLAAELQKGDLPLSRAHWMLGAQQLASGQFAGALESFQQAERYAAAANAPAEAELAAGFAVIAKIVEAADNSQREAAQNELQIIRDRLKSLPDGEAFCGQFDGALQVFTRPSGSPGYA
jgi:hypothetical protein